MKSSKYFILIVTLLLLNVTVVNATSGALRKNSIKTCNGVTYGNHSSKGVIHWHQARADEDVSSGWIAVGEAIYSDPCSVNVDDDDSSNNNTDNDNSNSESNDNDSSNNNGNTSDNNSKEENTPNNNSSTNNNTGSTDNKVESNTSNNTNKNETTNNNSSSNNNTGTTDNKVETNTSNNSDTNKNETTNKKEDDEKEEIEVIKSNDASLKEIVIDGKKIEILDNMIYSTTNEKINIEVSTNDTKATYEIKNNNNLVIGENIVVIDVTAEDGTIQTYNINVTRERIISSDTGIKVMVNNEEVIFEKYKATVYIFSSETNIDFNYELNDKNAKVQVQELSDIKYGDNIIKIKVTAEDGSIQEYEVNIYKYTKTEEIIYSVIGFLFLGGSGYLIYFGIKKFKNLKMKKNEIKP